MVFLDDDGGAGAGRAHDLEAERRADGLTVEQTAVLALEFDALASQIVLKGIQFGQSRAGFIQAMASHWDSKSRQFRQMLVHAEAIVDNRRRAREARPPDRPSCPPDCKIAEPHDHAAEEQPHG